jgi:hypothetical protein
MLKIAPNYHPHFADEVSRHRKTAKFPRDKKPVTAEPGS